MTTGTPPGGPSRQARADRLGAAHTGGVESHEDGAVAEVGGGVDEAGDLLGAENDGDLVLMSARQGKIVARVARSSPWRWCAA
jgi:hypothetical protein